MSDQIERLAKILSTTFSSRKVESQGKIHTLSYGDDGKIVLSATVEVGNTTQKINIAAGKTVKIGDTVTMNRDVNQVVNPIWDYLETIGSVSPADDLLSINPNFPKVNTREIKIVDSPPQAGGQFSTLIVSCDEIDQIFSPKEMIVAFKKSTDINPYPERWDNFRITLSTPAKTKLQSAITSTDTEFFVLSDSYFPTSGEILLDSEIIFYNNFNRTLKKIYSLTRGYKGTIAAAHNINTNVIDLQKGTTKLNVAVSATDTTFVVQDVSGFPFQNGRFKIDNEIIAYDSWTKTYTGSNHAFLNCVRINGAPHLINTNVIETVRQINGSKNGLELSTLTNNISYIVSITWTDGKQIADWTAPQEIVGAVDTTIPLPIDFMSVNDSINDIIYVDWPNSIDLDADHYEIQIRRPSSQGSPQVSSYNITSSNYSFVFSAIGRPYGSLRRFRVRTIDRSGNVGKWNRYYYDSTGTQQTAWLGDGTGVWDGWLPRTSSPTDETQLGNWSQLKPYPIQPPVKPTNFHVDSYVTYYNGNAWRAKVVLAWDTHPDPDVIAFRLFKTDGSNTLWGATPNTTYTIEDLPLGFASRVLITADDTQGFSSPTNPPILSQAVEYLNVSFKPNHANPVGTGNPNANQIRVYAGTNYTGNNVTLDVGFYTQTALIPLSSSYQIGSIKVGSNVQVELRPHDHTTDPFYGEIFYTDDDNLSNNPVVNIPFTTPTTVTVDPPSSFSVLGSTTNYVNNYQSLVEFKWLPSATAGVTYTIHYSTDNSFFASVPVTTVSKGGSYIGSIIALQPGTLYYFKVSANAGTFNSNLIPTSALSYTTAAIPAPAIPTSFTLSSTNINYVNGTYQAEIILNWTFTGSDIQCAEIFYKKDVDSIYQNSIFVPRDQLTVTISDLLPNTNYNFKIRSESYGNSYSAFLQNTADPIGSGVILSPDSPTGLIVSSSNLVNVKNQIYATVSLGWNTVSTPYNDVVEYIASYRTYTGGVYGPPQSIPPTSNNSVTVFYLLVNTFYEFTVKAKAFSNLYSSSAFLTTIETPSTIYKTPNISVSTLSTLSTFFSENLSVSWQVDYPERVNYYEITVIGNSITKVYTSTSPNFYLPVFTNIETFSTAASFSLSIVGKGVFGNTNVLTSTVTDLPLDPPTGVTLSTANGNMLRCVITPASNKTTLFESIVQSSVTGANIWSTNSTSNTGFMFLFTAIIGRDYKVLVRTVDKLTVFSTTTVTSNIMSVTGIGATDIQDNVITTVKIVDNAIDSNKLANNSVISSKIASSAVDSTKLATNAAAINVNAGSTKVSGSQLVDASVNNLQLALLSVATGNIQASAITTVKIATDAITANEIAAAAVGISEIATGAVTTIKIANNAVGTSQLALLAVDNTILAANAAATNINAGATTINGIKITSGTVDSAQLASLAVTTAKISALAVDNSKLALLSIATGNLQAGAITAAKIATDTITANEIAVDAITSSELANNAVTTAKINALAVDNSKIAALAIDNSKIALLSVATGNLQANAVTITKLGLLAVDNTILAVNSAATNINAGTTTVDGGKLTNSTVGDAQIIGISGSKVSGAVTTATTATTANLLANTSAAGNSSATAINSQISSIVNVNKIDGLASVNAINGQGVGVSVIAANAIGTSQIAAGAVTTAKIAANAVGTGQIALLAVDSTILAASAVTTAKIANNAIGTGQMALLAVDNTILAAGSVTNTKIANNAVGTGQMTLLAVDSTILAAGSVTTAKIANNAVGTGQIALLAVDSTILAAGSVTTAKIAANAVGTGQITNNAIGTSQLALLAVDSTILAASSVTTAKVAANAIGTGQMGLLTVDSTILAAGAVTTVKIAANAVGASQIANNSVGTGQMGLLTVDSTILAAGAVTTAKIAATAVGTGQMALLAVNSTILAAGAVTTAKVANNAIGTSQLALLAVDNTILAAGAVIAGKIASGVVGTTEIAANAITTAKLALLSVDNTILAVNSASANVNAGTTLITKLDGSSAILAINADVGAIKITKIDGNASATAINTAGATINNAATATTSNNLSTTGYSNVNAAGLLLSGSANSTFAAPNLANTNAAGNTAALAIKTAALAGGSASSDLALAANAGTTSIENYTGKPFSEIENADFRYYNGTTPKGWTINSSSNCTYGLISGGTAGFRINFTAVGSLSMTSSKVNGNFINADLYSVGLYRYSVTSVTDVYLDTYDNSNTLLNSYKVVIGVTGFGYQTASGSLFGGGSTWAYFRVRLVVTSTAVTFNDFYYLRIGRLLGGYALDATSDYTFGTIKLGKRDVSTALDVSTYSYPITDTSMELPLTDSSGTQVTNEKGLSSGRGGVYNNCTLSTSNGVLLNGTTSYISIPNSTTFDLATGNWGVGLSFKATSLPGGTKKRLIGHSNPTGTGGWSLFINGANQLELDKMSVIPLLTDASTTLVINTWYRIFLVKSGTAYSFYLNNSNIASATTANVPNTTTGSLELGAIQDNGATRAEFFAGYMKGAVIMPFDFTNRQLTIDNAWAAMNF